MSSGLQQVQLVNGSIAVTGTTTGNQGSPNTPANSWPVEITDGTNVLGTAAHPVNTVSAAPTAANILDGLMTATTTTAATTIITIPATRTWIGYVTISCSCAETAAGTVQSQAVGIISTAGTNVTPAAGNYVECDAYAGINATAGTVGSQAQNSLTIRMVVVAPAGNSVTIQGATVNAGSITKTTISCIGELQ